MRSCGARVITISNGQRLGPRRAQFGRHIGEAGEFHDLGGDAAAARIAVGLVDQGAHRRAGHVRDLAIHPGEQRPGAPRRPELVAQHRRDAVYVGELNCPRARRATATPAWASCACRIGIVPSYITTRSGAKPRTAPRRAGWRGCPGPRPRWWRRPDGDRSPRRRARRCALRAATGGRHIRRCTGGRDHALRRGGGRVCGQDQAGQGRGSPAMRPAHIAGIVRAYHLSPANTGDFMRTNFITFAFAGCVAAAPACASTAADILAANKAASGGKAWDGKAALKAGRLCRSGHDRQGHLARRSRARLLGRRRHGRPRHPGQRFRTALTPGRRMLQARSPTRTGGEQRQLAVNEGYRRANTWWRRRFRRRLRRR